MSAGVNQLPCGLCQGSVYRADFEAGRAQVIRDVLYCPRCLRDVERARAETLAFRQRVERGAHTRCAQCERAVPPSQIEAGGVVVYEGALFCVECSRDLVRILVAKRVGGRAPAGDVAADAIACPGCGGPVSPTAEGATRSGADWYCGACAGALAAVMQETRGDATRLLSFACSRCDAPVALDDFDTGKAVHHRGEIVCAPCREAPAAPAEARSPRSGSERQSGGATPCAGCQRDVPLLDVRVGKAAEVDGRLVCGRCLPEEREAAARRRRRAGLRCAACERALPARRIERGEAVEVDGAVLCRDCALSPERVPGAKDMDPETLSKSLEDLRVGLTELGLEFVCDGCDGPVLGDDLRAGRARSIGPKTFCPPCAGRELEAREERQRHCVRCRAPLPQEASPALPCLACREAERSDREARDDALKLTGQGAVSLRCARCRVTVPVDDLQSGAARAVQGNVYCARHAAGEAARTSPAVGLVCPTCDAPVGPKPYRFAGRRFCRGCEPAFSRVLERGALGPGQEGPCTLCGKPARGDRALRLGRAYYCGGCRRAAALVVQVEVRGLRSGRGRRVPLTARQRRNLLICAGVGAWALGVVVLIPSLAEARRRDGAPPAARPSPAQSAFERARVLVRFPPVGFAAADELLSALRAEQEAIAGEPGLAAAFAEWVRRAEGWRVSRAAALAPRVLLDAAARARTGDAAAAVAALAVFPDDLLDHAVGEDVRRAARRYGALARCHQAASALHPLTGAARAAAIRDLLESADSAACDFVRTEVGGRLAAGARLLEGVARRSPTGTAGAGRVELSTAAAQVEAGDLEQARATYLDALRRDRFSVPALTGLARVALEAEDLAGFLRHVRRLGRLRPEAPETLLLLAWREYLTRADEPARALLGRVPAGARGAAGARLAALLAGGASVAADRRVSVHGAPAAAAALAAASEAAARATTALAADGAVGRVHLFLLAPGERRFLLDALRIEPTRAGVLPGCSAAVLEPGSDAGALRRAAAGVVARQAIGAPAWLRAALPEALAGVEGGGRAALARLESLDEAALRADGRLWAAALATAALARTDAGAQALGEYTAARAREPEQAAGRLVRFWEGQR